MIMSILSIILLAASFPIDIARAAPWHTVHARQSNGSGNNNNNNNNNNNGGLSSSVWIPVVFIGGLFLLSAVWVLQKKMTGGSTNASGNAVPNSTVTGQTRELTAEDLASGTRPTNTRRQRRPRRTPSQVSTRSLPAYMKEPGDNEVVIYRGLEDMDEETEGELHNAQNSTTTTADMSMDTGRTDRDSHDDTHALLQFRTDSPELMRHSVHLTRGSYDHHGSDDSHARLIDVQRGEAPAYETIDLNATEGPVTAHGHQNSQSAGVSGFFSRFMPQRGNNGNSSELTTLSPPSDSLNPIIPSSHSREPSAQSGTSGVASADSHDLPRRSHADRTHRNNNSSTGSVFTLFSRTIPRNHDDGPLTSPSTLSLNSISPPLTHTATRTEFTYPRTGPTSEQVKFLSSKETFGRFGVPYGPDAIAFAASSSRLDLPPDFDSEHRPSFSDLLATPDDGLASNLRRSTSAGRLSTDDHSDLGGFALPESAEPSQDRSLTDLDQPPSMRELTPDLEVDAIPPPLRDPLSKQKSTPNLGVGHPSLLKPALKSKSISNLQKDGGGSLLPRSASAAGSYLTVESFQTAQDDGDASVPFQSLGPLPQITVQMPSNNPSSVNLVEEGSDSEAEFFDGEEDMEGSEGMQSVRGRGDKAQRVPSLNEGHQSHAQGRGQEVIKEGDTPSRRIQNSRAYTLSTNSDSDDGSDADTHSQHTGVGKAADMEPRHTQRLHGMMDPEMVAITLKKTSPNSTKAAVETSRTTTIEA
ncbi:hypothetical protein BJ322DRAFT_270985 [Thelephora terrestris]|uniref:Uncharacterized protein n=1 Tax=Thelephora terrestris TaxID=56493 RepID=A0A9P6H8I4_9AGAM|nr:hypothetical protein BJ322DRAFT_270985 [Thelephora terrestris]